MLSSAGVLLLTSPSTTPLSLTKRSGLEIAGPRRVVFEQEMIDARAG